MSSPSAPPRRTLIRLVQSGFTAFPDFSGRLADRLPRMTTFGLVHGAWHGAWCWEQLIPELERLGHRAVAMDLPCDDPSATYSSYADVIVDALVDEPDDVVLVAHSMGGLSMP